MKKAKKRPILRWVLLALLLVLAALLLINRYTVRQAWCNMFAPTLPLDESADWSGGTSYEHLAYADDSEAQYIDLYVPDTQEPAPLFVLIHGGGFAFNDAQSRQAQFMYRYFRDHGFACASINYRLATEAPFPAAIQDCKAAIRFLRAHAQEYGYSADHLSVWGESAGGYLAIMCAVTNDTQFNDLTFIGQQETGNVTARVDTLVDYYGLVDSQTLEAQWNELQIPAFVRQIANSWLSGDVLEGYEDIHSYWLRKNISEMTPEEYAVTNPLTYVQQNDLSHLTAWIVHGDCDITVPYLQSADFAQVLSEKTAPDKVIFKLIPRLGHAADMLYSNELLGELDAFLKSIHTPGK